MFLLQGFCLNFDFEINLNLHIMKTPFIKILAALTLSLSGLAGFSQCPTFTGINVSNGQNGIATLMAVSNTTAYPAGSSFYWQVNSSATQTMGNQNYVQYQFPANGSYTVCMSYNDSIAMCSSTQCTVVTITNMTTTACNAAYTFYNDSMCMTHFINSSTGSNLTYKWYDLSGFTLLSTQSNPVLNLGVGSHNIALYTYANGQFCDSLSTYVNVSCSASSTCQAAFSAVTQATSCATYFTNTSIGSNLTYQWYNMSTFNLISTQQNPLLILGNGTHVIGLYTLSNGQFCDSVVHTITVNCNSSSGGCNANSQFLIFADSLNAGSYFAYNQSSGTGNVTYLWNFGDGNTSTQLYPFHQYAIPGQYVVCLTITATNGTLTCTDTYCDSSSVHRIASGFLMSKIQVKPQSVTGIKNHESNIGMSIYPNPVESELTIELQNPENNQLLYYTLTDALGKTVITGNLAELKTTVNTSNLDKGIYFIAVINGNNKVIKTTKIIK